MENKQNLDNLPIDSLTFYENPDVYISIAEKVLNISLKELSGKSRKRIYVSYRAAITRRLKEIFKNNITLTSIGNIFKRDHSTIAHYLKYESKYFIELSKAEELLINNNL